MSANIDEENKPLHKETENQNENVNIQIQEPTKVSKNIKQAYKDKDVDKSRQFHEKKLELQQRRKEKQQRYDDHVKQEQRTSSNKDGNENLLTSSNNNTKDEEITFEFGAEKHKSLGDYVKSIIYGGLDGIITTFAVVAGVQGADLDAEVILVLGFANLVADGLSMGVGDFLSEKAEIDFARSEREREKWEFDHFQEGEIQEMIEIYETKGISNEDATTILRIMAKYPKFFIDHMMIQELDINPPEEDAAPIKNGLVTMTSFLAFGCIPLLAYLIFEGVKFDNYDPKFLISIILTCICLFVLGFVKGKLTESHMIQSGFFVLINGAIAAGASYLIGWALAELTGIHGDHSG